MNAFFDGDLAAWVGRHGVSPDDLHMGALSSAVRTACDPEVAGRESATLREILAGGVGETLTARTLTAYLRHKPYGAALPRFEEIDNYVPAGLAVAPSPALAWATWVSFVEQVAGRIDGHLAIGHNRAGATHRDFNTVAFVVAALNELGIPIDLYSSRAWQTLSGGLGLDKTWRLLESFAKDGAALGVLRRANDRAEGVDTGDMVAPGFDVGTDELGALSGGHFPGWTPRR